MEDRLVCYILPTFRLGGTEKQVIALSKGVLEHNRVAFICLRGAEDLASWLSLPDKWVLDAQMQGKRDFWVVKRVRSMLRTLAPDIVHCFLFDANVWGVFAAKWAKVPVILSSRRSVDTWQNSRHIFFEKRSNRCVDMVTANSHAVASFTVAQEDLPEERCRVLYGGVDTDHFKPPLKEPSRTRWFHNNPTFVVGIVATLMPEKRHDLFLKAARVVADQVPGARFLIVGNGPWRESVEEEAKDLHLEDHVFLTGELLDPAPAYASMDVSVLCSDREGFSNAILEAMSAGLPVVATDVGGNAEAVVEGKTGFIVPTNDPNLLADRILQLAKHPDVRTKMGAAGRERAVHHFSLQQMIQGHLDLYDELLSAAEGRESSEG